MSSYYPKALGIVPAHALSSPDLWPGGNSGKVSSMWRDLVERYAMRTREFSDAVATLGKQAHLGPEQSNKMLDEIKRHRELCNAVADEIDRYIEQQSAVGQTA